MWQSRHESPRRSGHPKQKPEVPWCVGPVLAEASEQVKGTVWSTGVISACVCERDAEPGQRSAVGWPPTSSAGATEKNCQAKEIRGKMESTPLQ